MATHLPEFDLPCDNAFVRVWALVDSGAEPNAAQHKRFISNASTEMRPFDGEYAAANGN